MGWAGEEVAYELVDSAANMTRSALNTLHEGLSSAMSKNALREEDVQVARIVMIALLMVMLTILLYAQLRKCITDRRRRRRCRLAAEEAKAPADEDDNEVLETEAGEAVKKPRGDEEDEDEEEGEVTPKRTRAKSPTKKIRVTVKSKEKKQREKFLD